MRYAGVIAGPDKKSLSPVFQQAAIDALGLDAKYEAWPTPPEGLATRITTLRAPAALGANVTIPHKETIVPLLDSVYGVAERVGAVNTVVNVDGALNGYNTDVEGFLWALREDGGVDPGGKRALVAGAGGAARAVVVALADAGSASVTVIGRTFTRASKLVEELGADAGGTQLSALPDIYSSWAAASAGCDVLVNCTPAGTGSTADAENEEDSAVPLDMLHAGMLVYDLVYLPAETPLMAAARQRGARVLGGLPMLIYQGATSFRLWFGVDAPVDTMIAAARGALEGEGGDPK
jgi:shikimate dehydrogenase